MTPGAMNERTFDIVAAGVLRWRPANISVKAARRGSAREAKPAGIRMFGQSAIGSRCGA